MRVRVWLIGLCATVPAAAQDKGTDPREEVLTRPFEDRRDLTLLRKVAERVYVHDATGVTFTVPSGWTEIRPHRLARRIDPRISTVLGIERADRDLVASLYWVPMGPGQKLADWVRETPVGGEYGEEYETLRAVYGKERVTTPDRVRHGPFDVYRVHVRGGPDRGDRYDGTLYVFEVESAGTRWLLKARVSYPKAEAGRNDQYAAEVLHGYARLPDAGPDARKLPPDLERLAEIIVPARGALPKK
jgi:hypothetical protein